jgi:hypothetical protein
MDDSERGMRNPLALTGVMTALSVSILVLAVASAQDRPPLTQAPSDTPSRQQECSPDIDPSDRSKGETQGKGSENLSEKLSRSDGVICPPRTPDSEIVTPPPGGGRTPVIPPPGSPGGDPNLRPK